MSSPVPAGGDRLPALELPTLALILACYGGWLALTRAYGVWPLWLLAPAIAVLLTLHSSLQHEILHGHPTRREALNRLFGIVPLSLWIPYARYRVTHLAHHVNHRLTDPLDDPESNYLRPEDWAALGPLARRVVLVEGTLAGRVLLGPWLRIARFLRAEAGAFARNEPGVRAAWLEHLVWCIPVVLWLRLACGMPLWIYVVTMVVPGYGILLIRSFAEHRALSDPRQRTAIIEGSRILGPLFLFNNLHALHHEQPALPWYRYNARYRELRERLVAENGGLVYATYLDLARRYLFRAHDRPVHPTARVPPRGA